MDGGPGGLQSTGSQRVGHDWATSLTNDGHKWISLSWGFQMELRTYKRAGQVARGMQGRGESTPSGLWPGRHVAPHVWARADLLHFPPLWLWAQVTPAQAGSGRGSRHTPRTPCSVSSLPPPCFSLKLLSDVHHLRIAGGPLKWLPPGQVSHTVWFSATFPVTGPSFGSEAHSWSNHHALGAGHTPMSLVLGWSSTLGLWGWEPAQMPRYGLWVERMWSSLLTHTHKWTQSCSERKWPWMLGRQVTSLPGFAASPSLLMLREWG